MPLHNSWRLRTLCAYDSAGDTVLITDLSWFDVYGNTINAALSPFGSTPQYTGGESAAQAYDNNSDTWFQANNFPVIGFLNIPSQIVAFSIRCHPGYPDRSPVSWVVEYSDDTTTGFDGTWRPASLHTYDFTSQANPAVFNIPGPTQTAKYWLVLGTAYVRAGTQFSASKLEMHGVAGGSDLCSGGSPLASRNYGSGYTPDLAFDGNPGSYSLSRYTNAYLGYNFPSPVDIAEIELTPRTDAYFYQVPTTLLVACSSNGSDWSIRGTVAMPFDGNAAETYTASVPDVVDPNLPPPTYRRRFNYIA